MSEPKLLPCPFCGGEAVLMDDSPAPNLIYGVGCGNTECLAYTGYGLKLYGTEAEAVEAWNTRAAVTEGQFATAVHDGRLWRVERTCHFVMTSPGWWECDECFGGIDWDSCDEDDPPGGNYCPNCGARVVDE